MRTLIRLGLVVMGLTASAPAFAQWHDNASTTRIETRPFYGATVTVEHGVRVYRALPPTRHMIINPHGETPLSLGIQDTRVYEKSESHNHFYDHSSGVSPGVVGAAGVPVVAGRKFARGRHGARGRPGGVGGPKRKAPQKRYKLRPIMKKGGGHH